MLDREKEGDEMNGRPKLGEEEEEKTFRDPYMRKAEIRIVEAMAGEGDRLREMAEVRTISPFGRRAWSSGRDSDFLIDFSSLASNLDGSTGRPQL